MLRSYAGLFTQFCLMWGLIFYLAIFPSILALLFWNEGIIKLGPAKSANFYHLILVFASIFSILLGEVYTIHHFIATLFIITGIMVSSIVIKPVRRNVNEQEI